MRYKSHNDCLSKIRFVLSFLFFFLRERWVLKATQLQGKQRDREKKRELDEREREQDLFFQFVSGSATGIDLFKNYYIVFQLYCYNSVKYIYYKCIVTLSPYHQRAPMSPLCLPYVTCRSTFPISPLEQLSPSCLHFIIYSQPKVQSLLVSAYSCLSFHNTQMSELIGTDFILMTYFA